MDKTASRMAITLVTTSAALSLIRRPRKAVRQSMTDESAERAAQGGKPNKAGFSGSVAVSLVTTITDTIAAGGLDFYCDSL